MTRRTGPKIDTTGESLSVGYAPEGGLQAWIDCATSRVSYHGFDNPEVYKNSEMVAINPFLLVLTLRSQGGTCTGNRRNTSAR